MALPPGVDPTVFADLKREHDARRVVVFAGAGVSAGAGLPSWKKLAELLVARMRQKGATDAALQETEDLIQRGDLVTAMSAARAALRRDFDIELARHLDDSPHAVPPAAQAIAALGSSLAGVVTTNLDRFLERAFGGEWPPIVKPVQDLLRRPRYIFKPHGTLDDPETWVFTREEYDQVMFGSAALQDLFGALYRSRTILFVGASLTDDDFGLTLGRIRALAGRSPPTHYAILPGPIGPVRRDQLEKAGVRLLVYENASKAHREVIDILQCLTGSSSAQPSPAPQAAPVPQAAPAQPPLPAPVRPAAAPQSPAAAKLEPVYLFLSAAPRDAAWRDRLIAHLTPLETAGRIRLRHAVPPGWNTQATIRDYIDNARIVLILVSPDHLASSDHAEHATRALGVASKGRSVVVPVILRACAWDLSPLLGKLEPLPADGKPIASRSDADAAMLEVVAGVRAMLDALPP